MMPNKLKGIVKLNNYKRLRKNMRNNFLKIAKIKSKI